MAETGPEKSALVRSLWIVAWASCPGTVWKPVLQFKHTGIGIGIAIGIDPGPFRAAFDPDSDGLVLPLFSKQVMRNGISTLSAHGGVIALAGPDAKIGPSRHLDHDVAKRSVGARI